MQKLTILNTREIKKLREIVKKQFNHFPKEDYAYLMNEKNKVFLINKDIAKIELKNLRIDKMGLYFAEWKNTEARLSKEGAQLLVNDAKRNKIKLENIIVFTKNEVKSYFEGNDLQKDLGEENKFVILEYDENVLGCAKYKEKIIINFLPKIHRGEVIV